MLTVVETGLIFGCCRTPLLAIDGWFAWAVCAATGAVVVVIVLGGGVNDLLALKWCIDCCSVAMGDVPERNVVFALFDRGLTEMSECKTMCELKIGYLIEYRPINILTVVVGHIFVGGHCWIEASRCGTHDVRLSEAKSDAPVRCSGRLLSGWRQSGCAASCRLTAFI